MSFSDVEMKDGMGTAMQITVHGTPYSAETNGTEDSDQRETWFLSNDKMSKLVNKNRVTLVKIGDFDQIRDYMLQYEVFSQDEVESIEERNVGYMKMRECLDYLIRKPPEVIEKFFAVLEEADKYLYRQLDRNFPTDEEIKECPGGIQDHMEDDLMIAINIRMKKNEPLLQADIKPNVYKANDKQENENPQIEMKKFGHYSMLWERQILQQEHPGLQEAYRKHWHFIQPEVSISARYNERQHNLPFTTFKNLRKDVKAIFDKECGYFKINIAVGYLYKISEMEGYKYFHPGRSSYVLSGEVLVSDEATLESLLRLLWEASLPRKNKLTTNFKFYVKRLTY